MASIQPRTILVKFTRSPCTDPQGCGRLHSQLLHSQRNEAVLGHLRERVVRAADDGQAAESGHRSCSVRVPAWVSTLTSYWFIRHWFFLYESVEMTSQKCIEIIIRKIQGHLKFFIVTASLNKADAPNIPRTSYQNRWFLIIKNICIILNILLRMEHEMILRWKR